MKKETTKVEINIYDADGEMCEGIGGPMDFDDVKEQMIIALRNDGIPVVRAVGKNKTNEAHKPECAVPSWEQPMTIRLPGRILACSRSSSATVWACLVISSYMICPPFPGH